MEFRLDLIDSNLGELKALLIKVPIMAENITALQNGQENIRKICERHEKDIENLKAAPDKDAGQKWRKTVEILYKTIIVACATVILVKIGLT